jgi:hypothetical protein
MISMQIINAQAVQNALNKFEKKISKKIVRDAVRAGSKPLLTDVKSNAKSLTSTQIKGIKKSARIGSIIARSLHLKVIKASVLRRKYGRDAWGQTIVPKKGSNDLFASISKAGKRYYIPAAIEYGHAFPGRGGSGAKDVPAKKFIRPAWDKHKAKMPSIFKQHLIRAIREENMKRR